LITAGDALTEKHKSMHAAKAHVAKESSSLSLVSLRATRIASKSSLKSTASPRTQVPQRVVSDSSSDDADSFV
jgi:hypothetical protein